MNDSILIKNGESVELKNLPVVNYEPFCDLLVERLGGSHPEKHCVNYFGYWTGRSVIRLIACVADDQRHDIEILTTEVIKDECLQSISAKVNALERYEREISEQLGLGYKGHPWMKPVRSCPDDYPFYSMEGEELHEVGVGPIHAGVIEPGHFRFICNGEKILHLEIMLGYQHRDVENLMLDREMLSQRAMLAENVAGDTAVGHGCAFASVWESLCGAKISERTILERTLALELERMAIHTGDLSAICGDIAYQLGNAVYGRLRTPLINFMQCWCGNRLGKFCVRPFQNNYPFTADLACQLDGILKAYERDFEEVSNHLLHFPGALSRLERTGTVTTEQASAIGAVGMAARASGLDRDIRKSHPFLGWGSFVEAEPVVKHHGDVLSRTSVRVNEIRKSMVYVRALAAKLAAMPLDETVDTASYAPMPDRLAVSLVEGWRGEICHCAITDSKGKLLRYKFKDPSFHNWMALALAVRDNEISDFPICNKSFNLSYCGHDL